MSISTHPVTRIPLPPAVQKLLSRVRSRLRRDSAATGLLLAFCFAVLAFWITITLDAGWFQLQKLELPVGLRAVILAFLLPTSIWLLASRVLFPLVRRVHDQDVALVLERRFPQFQDRLITTVETAQGLPEEGPLVRPMLERSVLEADRLAASVAVGDVFDATSIKRLGLIACGLLCSMTIMMIVEPQMLARWWSAFIRCDETYHERTTHLNLLAIAQPGDRRIEFQALGERLTYRHPRGADLELEISVPDNGPAEGLNWKVPDRVRIDVLRKDGSTSRTYVSATSASERRFRFVITRLQEPVDIELLAGDYRTRVPYHVEVVNTPALDVIRMNCRFPEYTGWNQLRETDISPTGSEVQLPVGTSFQLVATASKPLMAARIVSDEFELSGDREGSRLISRQGRATESSGKPLISEDGLQLTAAFEILYQAAEDAASDRGSEASETTLSTDPLPSKSGVLQIPSSTNLRIFLHDTDDVMSVSPETLRVQGIRDKPPVIVAQMTGIDNAVTRLAKIPIAGRLRDDYGLKSAGFEFQVDDESNWRPRQFRVPPVSGATEFDLRRSDSEAYELFDVQVLELTEGQRLTLSLVASDSNQFPGPGMTRSDPMLFRIVSIEELLSLLYTREIGLRGRFEEIIAQLEELNNDLQFHQDVARRIDTAGSNPVKEEDWLSLTTCATRSGNGLRRQANELNAIVEGFDEIVNQLINNAVPPQQLAENMRSTIVTPLSEIAGERIPLADRAVGEFRVAAQQRGMTEQLVRQSSSEVTQIITSMKAILENVRDMAEFHEALRDLKAIFDEQQQNLERTRKLQKNELFDDILK